MTPPGEPGARPGRTSASAARRGRLVRTAVCCVVAVAIVAGAGWALLGSSLLIVRHVEVTGAVPAAQVRAAAAIRPGTPLARLDGPAVARRVDRLTEVQSAAVSRSWPDTVVISVRARVAAVVVASAGGYELVDVDGVVIRQAARRPAGLPLLTAPPGRLRGSPAVRSVVLVLRGLPAALRGRVVSVTAPQAGAVSLRLRGGITVAWGGPGRAGAKSHELEILLRTHARHYDVSSPEVAVTSG